MRRPTIRERLAEDRGTITILLIGVLVVLLMVTAVTAAVTGVHLDRNRLQHAADGAALAGSQAIDPDAIYGPGADGTIDQAEAEARASDYLASGPIATGELRDVRITEMEIGADGTVRVTVEASTHPMLISWLTEAVQQPIPLTVVGEARSS